MAVHKNYLIFIILDFCLCIYKFVVYIFSCIYLFKLFDFIYIYICCVYILLYIFLFITIHMYIFLCLIVYFQLSFSMHDTCFIIFTSEVSIRILYTVIPVSYTHLDVYKRQIQQHSKVIITHSPNSQDRKMPHSKV